MNRNASDVKESAASSIDIRTGANSSTPGIPDPSTDFRLDSSDAGIGLQDLVTIGHRLHALFALRYDYSQLDFDLNPYPFTGKLDLENTSFRTGLIYEVNSSLSLFANYGTAYRPVFRTNNLGQSLFETQQSLQEEVGFKIVSPENRVTLNAALYHLTNQDVLITDSFGVPTRSDQVSYGFEMDLSARLSAATTLLFNYAYTESHYTKGPYEDNELFGTPNHSGGIWLHHTLMDDDAQNLSLNFGLNYHSKQFASDANLVTLPEAFQLSAGIQYQSGPWTYRLQGFNLLDKTDYVPVENLNVGSPNAPIYATPRAPRNFRISVSYEF